jgi:hypothetical protein
MPNAMVVASAAGLVVLLNLVLTYGVIRRLREHTILLARAFPARVPQAGHVVGDFAATAVDGAVVTRAWVERKGIVAFLRPGCEACEEALIGLTAYVRAAGRGLVMVEGEEAGTRRFAEAFAGFATVVAQRSEALEPVRKAFGVQAFPAVLAVGGGTVEAVLEPAAYRDPR